MKSWNGAMKWSSGMEPAWNGARWLSWQSPLEFTHQLEKQHTIYFFFLSPLCLAVFPFISITYVVTADDQFLPPAVCGGISHTHKLVTSSGKAKLGMLPVPMWTSLAQEENVRCMGMVMMLTTTCLLIIMMNPVPHMVKKKRER